ncbi:MAG: hypothetical protein Q9M50_13095 [Methylococcales bacterium]|nr:hypothetical protein [Methylococcales bacterium]
MINCFIFTALPCEAKAFISQFKLKKDASHHLFTIYSSEHLSLTVTGSGKIAMAAAVAYTLASLKSVKKPVLINAGIAGHQTAALGQLFSVHKISDADNNRNYYPQSIIQIDCLSLPVITVSKPENQYQTTSLYDMEASGFYEIAARFTTTELIQVFKVVSDNQTTGIEHINAKKVSAWMLTVIETMTTSIQSLQALATNLNPAILDDYEWLQAHYYFNVNHSYQLKAHLQRWNVITLSADLNLQEQRFNHSKDVLNWLQQKIDNQDFRL